MGRLGRFFTTVREQGLLPAMLRSRFVRPWIRRAAELTYWHDYTWTTTKWMGVPVMKYPSDAWSYQEILYESRPDLLIETGTYCGGSALFFASLFDVLGEGRVVTVDFEDRPGRPTHPRIQYLKGSSVAEETLRQVEALAATASRVMVVLDSDHAEEHVYKELLAYHRYVGEGQYLVVEDTNVNGHPVFRRHGPGPMEALDRFLPAHPEFQSDFSRERLGLTAHPRGFLKRLPLP